MVKIGKKEKNGELYKAILLLKDEQECYEFFQDLCTVSELRAMEQRFEVASLLDDGMIYNEILERTGASSATISRVNRSLSYGTGGLREDFRPVQEAGQMSSYDALAASYDALTVDVEYRRRADYLTRQFHRSALPVETVLDLACGTGTMACLLAERGYRMIAVDGSEEMLTQAAWKAAALEQPPMFLHQSMPRLHLGMEVDAAISTLDALNYLTRTADLRETLRRVYRWLRPGGLFLFDVNTPYKLRRMDGQVYLDETEDSYCVWRTFYAPGRKICTYQVDLFRLNANGSWDRAFEEHRERAWGREELETYLTEAGFGAVTVTGDLTSRPPAAEEDRWIFRCQKPVRPR